MSAELYNKYHASATKQIAKKILKLNQGKTARRMFRESGKYNNVNHNIVQGLINEVQLRTTGITIPSLDNTGTNPTISFLSASVFSPLLTVASIHNLESIFNNELNLAHQIAIEQKSNNIVIKFDIIKHLSNYPEYSDVFKAIDFTLIIKY